MRLTSAALLPLVTGLANAAACPDIGGMRLVWQENFSGPAGSGVNRNVWNIATVANTNNEVQTYTESSSNLQISGGGSVQFVPRKSASGQWSSSRIETKASFMPQPGKQMLIQASIRMGANANQQGIWPAFWLLGDAIRHGTQWPLCGELDIMEQVNGAMTAYGTAHCQQDKGGVCNEPSGKAGTTAIPDHSWHVWALRWDRTSNNWRTESITWVRDGAIYHVLTGNDIGNEAIWATLAHAPYYILMNVAVGGFWP